MSRTWKDSKNGVRRDAPRRNLSVRAVRRDHPDIRKLAHAVLDLAMVQLRTEQEAREQAEHSTTPAKPPRKPRQAGAQNSESGDV